RAPRDIAADIVAAVSERPELASVRVEGPGFINIDVADEFLGRFVETIAGDPRFGIPPVPSRRTIIDYGGPNVAKELHVGHVRTAIIGE
ncbi:MAG: arginine--tRNA ligase, partial [Gemmatimonadetes bacterium]|nr:arginine--tRNA ligase [Gemmatimonadota bacterium]